jgi:hypothetical protein
MDFIVLTGVSADMKKDGAAGFTAAPSVVHSNDSLYFHVK